MTGREAVAGGRIGVIAGEARKANTVHGKGVLQMSCAGLQHFGAHAADLQWATRPGMMAGSLPARVQTVYSLVGWVADGICARAATIVTRWRGRAHRRPCDGAREVSDLFRTRRKGDDGVEGG